MASSQQYHHFLTAGTTSKPKVRKILRALKSKARERDPDTGQFLAADPSRSAPLASDLTLIPPSPNTKRRIARERTKASRARNNNHRTSKDGSTFTISVGTQGIRRFSTKDTQKARPELGNGEGADVRVHHDVLESAGCSGEPCSDWPRIEVNDEAGMDWMAGSGEIDAEERITEKVLPGRTIISSSDSRRKYKENAAIAWVELIDGSDDFLIAFLQAESDLHCKDDTTVEQVENERVDYCKCSIISGEYCRAIMCVGLEGITTKSFKHCSKCKTLPIQLIRRGLFPASPVSPKTAFSISLLNFYATMNTVSHIPVQAFTDALVSGMEHRGHFFDLQFPFLQQLQFVIPWYEKTLRKAEMNTIALLDSTPASQSFTPIPVPSLSDKPGTLASKPGTASALLRRRCPNCFGRSTWGGDPNVAPDVIVALDGNFQHRRYKHIRADHPILSPGDQFNWLTDDEVEQARKHVEYCRSKNDHSDHSRPSRDVPGHILDECEKSYKASQEKMQDPETSIYDSKGIIAVVCRHDIPLFMLDIKSIGEPRYYAIALLQKLGKELPESATIGVMYDIGEQLDRSIGKHNLIPEMSPRLSFALALFHAFGHQMACQVVYSPRWKQGFGLTNGEGNERVWALSTDTIGAERVMGPHRRKLLLSKKMESIACRKRKLYNSFYKRMRDRIQKTCDRSNTLIQSIPANDDISWTKEKLLQQAEIKKNDHLNAKDCSASQLNENVGRLLDAVRSAGGMSKALKQVTLDLEQHDYAQMLLGNEELHGLREFAQRVVSSHEETLKELENLSENLGLSSVKIPENSQLTDTDHQYLRHLIHFQRYKKVLWTTLQAYQDEYGPIREAASRGGSARRLGTTQLQVSKKAMKSKIAHVKSALKKFNSVLEAMQQLRRPEFVPEGLIPRQLEADELLHIEPGDELWDEVFGGTPWIDSWNEQPCNRSIPEYAKSKAVREGIVAALALERAAEEEKRLDVERVNGLNEWIRSLYQVWECRSRYGNGSMKHRIDLWLQSVLRSRPRLGDFSPYHPKCPLLLYPPSQLLSILLDRHPSAFLYYISDVHGPNAEVLRARLEVSHQVAMGNETMIPDLNTDELQKLEDDIEDFYEADSVTGLQAMEDGDEADEIEADKAFSSVFQRITDMVLQDDNDNPGTGSSREKSTLPSARCLIQRADGLKPSEPIVPYTQRDLPPARLLMNIIDNPGNAFSVDPARIVGSAINASLCSSANRIQVGTSSRFYRETEITEEMLKTFDDFRHLDESIVRVCSHLILSTIGNNPLAQGILLRKNKYVLLNLRWNLQGNETIFRELELGRDNGWDMSSEWIVNVLLPGNARKYVLIRLDFLCSSFCLYCGTTLSLSETAHVRKIVKFLQEVYCLIWGFNASNVSALNCVQSPTTVRQELPSQSALWALRDLKFIMMSLSPNEGSFNAKEMRNWLRELIVTLPRESTMGVDSVKNQLLDRFSHLKLPISDLFSSLINTT